VPLVQQVQLAQLVLLETQGPQVLLAQLEILDRLVLLEIQAQLVHKDQLVQILLLQDLQEQLDLQVPRLQ
jgi:hypothetical protein